MCNAGQQPFYGNTVRANVRSTNPFIYQDEKERIEGGVVVDMFKVLADYLHFNYEILPSATWFVFYPNRTIGGALAGVSVSVL